MAREKRQPPAGLGCLGRDRVHRREELVEEMPLDRLHRRKLGQPLRLSRRLLIRPACQRDHQRDGQRRRDGPAGVASHRLQHRLPPAAASHLPLDQEHLRIVDPDRLDLDHRRVRQRTCLRDGLFKLGATAGQYHSQPGTGSPVQFADRSFQQLTGHLIQAVQHWQDQVILDEPRRGSPPHAAAAGQARIVLMNAAYHPLLDPFRRIPTRH